jgi:hypothetical protein
VAKVGAIDSITISLHSSGIAEMAIDLTNVEDSKLLENIFEFAFSYSPVVVARDLTYQQLGYTRYAIAQAPGSSVVNMKAIAQTLSAMEPGWSLQDEILISSVCSTNLQATRIREAVLAHAALQDIKQPLSVRKPFPQWAIAGVIGLVVGMAIGALAIAPMNF